MEYASDNWVSCKDNNKSGCFHTFLWKITVFTYWEPAVVLWLCFVVVVFVAGITEESVELSGDLGGIMCQ
jgi:hypothetical protein